MQTSLLATLAAVREAQAKGVTSLDRRDRLTEARDLYKRSRTLCEEFVETAPRAAKQAAAFGRDVERCEAALVALPAH